MGFFYTLPDDDDWPRRVPLQRRPRLKPRASKSLQHDNQPASRTFVLFIRDLQRLRREHRPERQCWRNLMCYLERMPSTNRDQ